MASASTKVRILGRSQLGVGWPALEDHLRELLMTQLTERQHLYQQALKQEGVQASARE